MTTRNDDRQPGLPIHHGPGDVSGKVPEAGHERPAQIHQADNSKIFNKLTGFPFACLKRKNPRMEHANTLVDSVSDERMKRFKEAGEEERLNMWLSYPDLRPEFDCLDNTFPPRKP